MLTRVQGKAKKKVLIYFKGKNILFKKIPRVNSQLWRRTPVINPTQQTSFMIYNLDEKHTEDML